jgi:hypothetical protein
VAALILTTALLLPFTSGIAGDAKETKSALESDPKGWIDLLANADLKDWKRVPIPPKSTLKEPSPWKYDADKKVLVCHGAGAGHEMLLCNKEFGDGIFHVEWRFNKTEANKGYNSGVYVRNSADGQIWHQAQVGSKNVGFLFGNTIKDGKEGRFNANDKKPQRGNEAGEWNIFEITCKGKNVTLWVNGAVTTEWKDCEVKSGFVGMEAEGYVIEFKKVMYKDMK